MADDAWRKRHADLVASRFKELAGFGRLIPRESLILLNIFDSGDYSIDFIARASMTEARLEEMGVAPARTLEILRSLREPESESEVSVLLMERNQHGSHYSVVNLFLS